MGMYPEWGWREKRCSKLRIRSADGQLVLAASSRLKLPEQVRHYLIENVIDPEESEVSATHGFN